jgi:hypothetical protein
MRVMTRKAGDFGVQFFMAAVIIQGQSRCYIKLFQRYIKRMKIVADQFGLSQSFFIMTADAKLICKIIVPGQFSSPQAF